MYSTDITVMFVQHPAQLGPRSNKVIAVQITNASICTYLNIHKGFYKDIHAQFHICETLDKVARKYKALNNTKLCTYLIYKQEKGIYSLSAEM